MCSISAIYRIHPDDRPYITPMNRSLAHRGPDDSGIYTDDTVCLCHNRLAVMDPARGRQPMSLVYCGRRYTLIYNGEIYNTDELKADLYTKGAEFSTDCDTEVLLWTYIFYGVDSPQHLNGIFAFLVYDHEAKSLFVARDRRGVKPLYYAVKGDQWFFASEPKAILQNPKIRPVIDRKGLWELVFLSPMTTMQSSVFRDIRQLRPGERLLITPDREVRDFYWKLEARECTDSLPEAVDRVRFLLQDAVRRQIRSDVPLCAFLSGGLDSSILTSLASRGMAEQGKRLSTYSFEYENNVANFQSSLFQPNRDDDYARRLAVDLCTDHTVLTAPTAEVADLLDGAAFARDLPGQADIDSSLLYFCRQVKKSHTVAISGECSDEIFGGYPWFYRPEMLSRDFFPWIHDPMARARLFRADLLQGEYGFDYLSKGYRRFMDSCPVLDSDSDSMRQSRIATCLSVRYFMQNLLARKDRMSMATALEVRVPFADHRIIEYLYNLPWEYKFRNGVEKSLLRDASAGFLPDYILHRKKSPYPKTFDPAYEALVRDRLLIKLREDSLFSALLNRSAIDSFLIGENVTWFGQLMSRPQLIAWLLQLSAWLEHYPIEICL